MEKRVPHTWKFYTTIGLVDFAAIFLLDLLIEGGYSHKILIHDLVIAIIFTGVFWLTERILFKKDK